MTARRRRLIKAGARGVVLYALNAQLTQMFTLLKLDSKFAIASDRAALEQATA